MVTKKSSRASSRCQEGQKAIWTSSLVDAHHAARSCRQHPASITSLERTFSPRRARLASTIQRQVLRSHPLSAPNWFHPCPVVKESHSQSAPQSHNWAGRSKRRMKLGALVGGHLNSSYQRHFIPLPSFSAQDTLKLQ